MLTPNGELVPASSVPPETNVPPKTNATRATPDPGKTAQESPAPDGLLIIDKPQGWTSHDVVGRMRRLARTRKVGHAGTLDPMATGVLVLGIGRATKLLTFLVGCDKDYDATIRLGQSTLTDDAEGVLLDSRGAADLTDDQITRAVERLTGAIEQVPSAVSAIKIKGERAYHRVRAGESVELLARPITVSRFEIRDIHRLGSRAAAGEQALGAKTEGPMETAQVAVIDVDVTVTVSSGTYVRALARDLGAHLGAGGHLTALRRTRVGGFGLDVAHTVEALVALRERREPPEELPVVALSDAARAGFSTRALDEREARALTYGQRIPSLAPGRLEPVAAFSPEGDLVAMLDESGPMARSHVVFPPASS